MKSRKSKKPPRLSIDDLYSAVRQKTIAPCYLFAGPEQFTADEAVTLLCNAAIPVEQRSFNFDILYAYEIDVNEIIALASSYPMMGEKRMVVVKEFEKLNKSDILTEYIKNPLESTILILISESPDFRKNPYRAFDDKAILDCKPVYDNQAPQWIMKRVKRYKKNITPEAAAMLAAYTGTALRQISNELDKLDIFTADRKEIVIDDVNAVVGVTKAFNIFELYKAVGFKDASNAINILDRMLERGESPVMIITMLTRFFKQIAMLGDLQAKNVPRQKIASELKINPFFVDEYFGYLKHHPSESIPGRFRSLLSADTSLKTTGKDPRLILSILLFSLMDKDSGYYETINELESQFSE